MTTYNHAYDMAFSFISSYADGTELLEDPEQLMLLAATIKTKITNMPLNELADNISCFDTFEETE